MIGTVSVKNAHRMLVTLQTFIKQIQETNTFLTIYVLDYCVELKLKHLALFDDLINYIILVFSLSLLI